MTRERSVAVVEYTTDEGHVIKLSADTVRKYLVQGQGHVTDQEVVMFLALCKYRKLNPFLREAYLIKYGDTQPATIVTGKDLHVKRAANNAKCEGYRAGIIVQDENGEIHERIGAFILENEKLVGGWAEVHRHGWTVPVKVTVSLKEYERRRKDGTLQRSWVEMPATMIRKVALVQALREAFPEEFGGMYAPEEMPVEPAELDVRPVQVNGTAELADSEFRVGNGLGNEDHAAEAGD